MDAKRIVTNLVLIIVCLIITVPIVIHLYPNLVGADSSYTVMSGSMSPALHPGDIVIVNEVEPATINIGDVVTVNSEGFIYTHRVVEKLEGETYNFRLKGDANEEPDQNLVDASQIIGKVALIFPFSHLYTPYGFASALLVPASLIIAKQVHAIHQYTKKRNKKETIRWRRKRKMTPILGTGTLLLALILTVSTTRIIAPYFLSGSSSYFFDSEGAGGLFWADPWEVMAAVDINPDPLNLNDQIQSVTAHIETEYDENDIVVDSVMLDDVIQATEGEVQIDGRLMVTFDGASVIAHLITEGYSDGDQVTIVISGRFTDDVRFIGEYTITVINQGDG